MSAHELYGRLRNGISLKTVNMMGEDPGMSTYFAMYIMRRMDAPKWVPACVVLEVLARFAKVEPVLRDPEVLVGLVELSTVRDFLSGERVADYEKEIFSRAGIPVHRRGVDGRLRPFIAVRFGQN